MQVGAVALEERVRAEREEDVEIAGRPAAHAGLAFAGEADAGAVLDAGRDVDRQRALARDAAGARAGRAGIVDHLAAALAAGQVRSSVKKPCAWRMRPAPPQVRAGLRLGAGLGAGAGAGLAGDRGRHAHLRGLAGEGLLERDLHVVAQVGAALAAGRGGRAPPPMPKMSSKISEKAEPKSAPKPCAAAALLEGGVAEAVIGGALVAVLEDLVGLVDFLEAVLAVLVAGIAVGMPLHRELAEGGLELAVVGGALDLEHLVVAALGHPRVPPRLAAAASPPAHRSTPSSFDKQMSHHPGAGPGAVIFVCSEAPVIDCLPQSSAQADFLFFLSSSTSVNSASTTSSFLAPPASPPGVAPPPPPAAASCCWLVHRLAELHGGLRQRVGLGLDRLGVVALERFLQVGHARSRSRAARPRRPWSRARRAPSRSNGPAPRRGSWPRPRPCASCPPRRAPRRP